MAARAASVTECSWCARCSAEHTTHVISLPFKKITLHSKPGSHVSGNTQTGRLELKATAQHSHTQGVGRMSVLCPDPCASFLPHCFWMPPWGWSLGVHFQLSFRGPPSGYQSRSARRNRECGVYTSPGGKISKALLPCPSGWDNFET